MKENLKIPRLLVWSTLFVLTTSIIFTTLSQKNQLPTPISINSQGQPTLGSEKAKVHLVIFEEPKCCNCKECTLKIFPKIKKEFIDTNLVKYTVIPVSFIPHSTMAAEALLGVYYNTPLKPNDALFFNYLDTLYAKQPDESIDWVTIDILLEYAKETSPEISLPKLKESLENHAYLEKIQKNTEYGEKVMEGHLATPMLYINGIPVKDLNFDEVSRIIHLVLE